MKADIFSLPYRARPCPPAMPEAVWRAFAEAADHRGSRDEWLVKWQAYQALHDQYYTPDGKLREQPKTESI
ncbi:hypothetical protein [Arsenicibacter rosenii]|uniref:Uncharacterized protein n=1 Tax=Arsenicibacter rosenii TaxID=1750698 RepID=A0A1S2VLZ7_9BACT|nr:hypothetical protein [Arsenicibacter rosenii]OIN59791.1 hypothetical protein BLX24_08005 [Arsenicibacter rosenii]